MGGMIAATVLAIFFVPVFYFVVQRRFGKTPERRAIPRAAAADAALSVPASAPAE